MLELGVLLGVVVVTVLVGGLFAWRNGRFSGEAPVAGTDPQAPVLDVSQFGAEPGERGTLVQFSSAFCAPCRTTRVVLADVVDLVPGIVTVEVDAELHLDVVRSWNILRTPTVLVLDPAGRVVSRASGAPTRDQVLATLAASLPDLKS